MHRPMFSERTRWDLRPTAWPTASTKRTGGVRVLDLTESNPTRAGPRGPADLLVALERPARPALRAGRLWPRRRARGGGRGPSRGAAVPVDPDRILLTASTSEAYAFLFKLLCDPGDEILVPRPGYPLFEYLANLESVRGLAIRASSTTAGGT